MVSEISLAELMQAVAQCRNFIDVLRYFGVKNTGASFRKLKDRLSREKIDTSHFLGIRSNTGKFWRGPTATLRTRNQHERGRTPVLRRALARLGVPYQCEICGQGPIHHGQILVLQIDHKDGVAGNDSPENLRYLCPNCHTQTPTFNRAKDGRVIVNKYNACSNGKVFALKESLRGGVIDRAQYDLLWADLIATSACSSPVKRRTGNGLRLTADQVTEIRAKFSSGEHNKCALAREYSADRSSIYKIVTRQTFKGVLP